jgi:arabinogalactan endo-1,4-beta-galactosidase
MQRLGFQAVFLFILGSTAISGPANDFAAGADFSHLAYFESLGVMYRSDGQPQDGLAILKDRGLTCVRLRLFTSSTAQAVSNPYNYINNLDYTLPLALRVKNAGLEFMLDFHYSDTWADPGHQRKPAAWASLTFGQLLDQMRQYNSNSIAAFRDAGITPDYVQVGNEITGGMLWPDGQVGGTYDTPTQWSKLAQLLTNAIAGIRDAAGAQMPKVVVHIDRGGDWGGTQWFFDHLTQQQVPFDVIGESYYPFWHGTLDNLRSCLTNAAARYHKPIMVVETAFPWTNSTNIFGIPASPTGQVDYLAELAQIIRRVPGGMGTGAFWWGAEYQSISGLSLAGFETKSFFDYGGNALPVVNAMGALAASLRIEATLTNGSIALSWPLSGAGSVLTTTTNLSPPTSWVAVTNAVQRNGTVFSVNLPVPGKSPSFYRLSAK